MSTFGCCCCCSSRPCAIPVYDGVQQQFTWLIEKQNVGSRNQNGVASSDTCGAPNWTQLQLHHHLGDPRVLQQQRA